MSKSALDQLLHAKSLATGYGCGTAEERETVFRAREELERLRNDSLELVSLKGSWEALRRNLRANPEGTRAMGLEWAL